MPKLPSCGLGPKEPYLRDTLAVLSSEEDRPGNTARVLSLQEEGLGFAILEAEDLAVAADIELTLHSERFVNNSLLPNRLEQ